MGEGGHYSAISLYYEIKHLKCFRIIECEYVIICLYKMNVNSSLMCFVIGLFQCKAKFAVFLELDKYEASKRPCDISGSVGGL